VVQPDQRDVVEVQPVRPSDVGAVEAVDDGVPGYIRSYLEPVKGIDLREKVREQFPRLEEQLMASEKDEDKRIILAFWLLDYVFDTEANKCMYALVSEQIEYTFILYYKDQNNQIQRDVKGGKLVKIVRKQLDKLIERTSYDRFHRIILENPDNQIGLCKQLFEPTELAERN